MDERILNVLEKGGNVILVSVLWLIGCIPVVTAGTSTAAMYYTVVKSIRKETGYPAKEFFRAYRMNLRQGIPATLLVAAAVLLMYFNLRYAVWVVRPNDSTIGVILEVVYAAFLILFLAIGTDMFPVLSRLQVKFTELLKITAWMSARHLLTTIGMLAVLVVQVVVCYVFLPGLAFIPAAGCLLQSVLLEPKLRKITLSGTGAASDENQWYNQS